MFIDCCKRNGLLITNKWFQKRNRKVYIRKEPEDRNQHELVYVLVNVDSGAAQRT
jgi:hypothetical protein